MPYSYRASGREASVQIRPDLLRLAPTATPRPHLGARAKRTDNALLSRVPTQIGPTNGLTPPPGHVTPDTPPLPPPAPTCATRPHPTSATCQKQMGNAAGCTPTSSNPKQTRELLHSTSGVQRPTNTTVESPFYSASRIFTPRTGDLNLNEPCNWGPPDSETT